MEGQGEREISVGLDTDIVFMCTVQNNEMFTNIYKLQKKSGVKIIGINDDFCLFLNLLTNSI